MHRPFLLPRKYSWYSFLLDWVDPRAIVRPKGLCQWKIPMTPSGIEPAKDKNISIFVTWWHHCLFQNSSGEEVKFDCLGTRFAGCERYKNKAAAAWGCRKTSWRSRPRRYWLLARLLTQQWDGVHRSFFPGGKIERTRKYKVCTQLKLYGRVFID
jgi:hypothetical protein